MKRLVVGVPWWLALFLWLAWFSVVILLTFGGLLLASVGGIVWCTGRAMEGWRPGAGASMMATGKGLARFTLIAVDAMNGHKQKPS